MNLQPGMRLGPYEILAPLGAGGMGEVYRARDTRLDREVAIKVLPEAFARDAERVARFQREAKVLASLNHPHIAAQVKLRDQGLSDRQPIALERTVEAGENRIDEAVCALYGVEGLPQLLGVRDAGEGDRAG